MARSRSRTRSVPKVPTEAERRYERLLAEQARSGVGLSEFARRRRLPASRLQWWKSELRRRAEARRAATEVSPNSTAGAGEKPPALLPVRVTDAAGAALDSVGRRRSSAREYEVCLAHSGHAVRIPAEFEPDQLSLLVRVLEGAC